MELASIIHQYYNAFINKHGDTVLPGHLKAMNAFAVAVLRIPASSMCSALIVIMQSGGLYPAATVVVQSVKTMKPASGLTGNWASCYRFPIIWLLLHCLMNYDQ